LQLRADRFNRSVRGQVSVRAWLLATRIAATTLAPDDASGVLPMLPRTLSVTGASPGVERFV
jgi:hypothetical protein